MRRHRFQAVERVIEAAELLGDLAEEVVFTGGAAVGLLITDPTVPAVRPTLDIDVIVEVASLAEYYRLQERLRGKGFMESMEDKVICRWRHGSIILDVMPTDEKILGFANRWYAEAVRNAQELTVSGVKLRLVTPAYFLGIKLEAFQGRGKSDFMLSQDMEDIVAVLDGKPEIVEEVRKAKGDIRAYLAIELGKLLADRDFLDALPGHLPGDAANQQRVPIILERMQVIVS